MITGSAGMGRGVRATRAVAAAIATLVALGSHLIGGGSAVFAIPPGCAPGGYVGQTLFE